MACEPQTLLTGTSCYLCLSPAQMQAMRIRLLCAIRDEEAMACDPQSLMNESNCILNCMSKTQMDAAELLLLCNIATNVAATAALGKVYCGNGAPVADPGTACAMYYDLTQGDIYKWRDSTGDWSA